MIVGQVTLPGRFGNNWSGATIQVEESGYTATTGSNGNFALTDVPATNGLSLKADAPGYLPARCTLPSLPEGELNLTGTALLSGDIDDDDVVDIADAVAIGVAFGGSGNGLPADINQSGEIDIFDVILVGVNFGEGIQNWDCLRQ